MLLRCCSAARTISTQSCSSFRTLTTSAPAHNAATQARKFKKRNTPILLAENRCALVRTWDLLRNPAEALALVRAIEQRYGRIESFHFKKDHNSPSTYQNQIRITFSDIESFKKLPRPPDFETLHIRAPRVQERRPGGIGLDEIMPVIKNDDDGKGGKVLEFLTADQVSEMDHDTQRTIDFRIERADRPYFTPSALRPPYMTDIYRKAVGARMLAWGGFAGMEPIDASRAITDKEFTEGTLDRVYMRTALREWATYLNVRNPFEIYEKDELDLASVEELQMEVEMEGEKEEREVKEMEEGGFGKEVQTQENESTLTPEDWVPLEIDQSLLPKEPIVQMMEMEDIKVNERPTTESPPLPTSPLTPPSQDSQATASDHVQSTEPSDSGNLLEQFSAPTGELISREHQKEKVQTQKEATERKSEDSDRDDVGDDLEENPRFEALFNRLKGILKK